MSEIPVERSNKICYVLTIALTARAFFCPQLRYLAEHGYDVTIVCSPDDALQAELGEHVRFVPITIPRGVSPLGMLRAIRSLRTFFEQERFDLVQYSTPNAAFCAALAGRMAGCNRRNYHLMGFRYLGASGVGRMILKKLEKLTCRWSTSIECVSPSNLELGVREKVFPRAKATVVWNGSTGGVDLRKFDYSRRDKWRREIREALGYSEDDFIFGFVGRITRDKGINEILTAYRGLRDRSKLLLVGNPEGLDTLDPALLVEAQQDDHIRFHGNVTDIERYFAAMDVVLLPSYREGFGNVIIEAAAVGTPAIVSNIPGPIDAVEVGRTALIVEVGDASDLASKMLQIRNQDSFGTPNSIAAFARERFDSQQLNEQILQRKEALLMTAER